MLAKLTLGLKNVMGVIGGNRGEIHKDIGQRIADLNLVVRPKLTIIDATRILLRNGPTGGNLEDVKVLDTLIASADTVAADAYATTLFGMKPEDIGSHGGRGQARPGRDGSVEGQDRRSLTWRSRSRLASRPWSRLLQHATSLWIPWRWWRRAAQLALLVVFLWLFRRTEYAGADQLAGGENIFFRLDPLAGAAAMLAARQFIAPVLAGAGRRRADDDLRPVLLRLGLPAGNAAGLLPPPVAADRPAHESLVRRPASGRAISRPG